MIFVVRSASKIRIIEESKCYRLFQLWRTLTSKLHIMRSKEVDIQTRRDSKLQKICFEKWRGSFVRINELESISQTVRQSDAQSRVLIAFRIWQTQFQKHRAIEANLLQKGKMIEQKSSRAHFWGWTLVAKAVIHHRRVELKLAIKAWRFVGMNVKADRLRCRRELRIQRRVYTIAFKGTFLTVG